MVVVVVVRSGGGADTLPHMHINKTTPTYDPDAADKGVPGGGGGLQERALGAPEEVPAGVGAVGC